MDEAPPKIEMSKNPNYTKGVDGMDLDQEVTFKKSSNKTRSNE